MAAGRMISKPLAERIELLGQAMGFKNLDPDNLRELAEKTLVLRFHKDEFLFHEGDRADLFHVVAEGFVKVIKHSSSGKSFTAVVANRGSTLNGVVLVDNRPRFMTAQAMGRVDVICLKRVDFVQAIQRFPEVATDIISILGRIVESSYDRIVDLINERVDQRLLNVLYMLYHKFGAELSFTSSELADLAGTTTETTLRVMGRLREMGIILSQRGQIIIADPTRLKKLSRGPFML